MKTIQKFLSKKEEQDVIDAISKAEDNTSGELKVHLESNSKTDPFKRATEVFDQLQMNKTELKNGVLIYIAVEDKAIAIIGDSGINKVVHSNFWDQTIELILNGFKNENMKQGLVDGILKTGEELKKYFPFREGDINELSDEISSN